MIRTEVLNLGGKGLRCLATFLFPVRQKFVKIGALEILISKKIKVFKFLWRTNVSNVSMINLKKLTSYKKYSFIKGGTGFCWHCQKGRVCKTLRIPGKEYPLECS